MVYAGVDGGHPADVSSRLAPPYDMVDAAMRRRLLAADARNIIALDLPGEDAEASQPYAPGRELLEQWRGAGVLKSADEGLAVVRQTFVDPAGRTMRRTALLGAVPMEAAGVRAHEEIVGLTCDDRAACFESLRLQPSPVFGLYDDTAGSVEDLLRRAMLSRVADRAGRTADGVVHEAWLIREGEEAAAIREAFGERMIVIADGHHRYAALQMVAERDRAAGRAPSPALFALVSIQDPGMLLLPLVWLMSTSAEVSGASLEEAAREWFTVEPVSSSPERLADVICTCGFEELHPMGLFDLELKRSSLLTTRSIDPLGAVYPDRSTKWRTMDATIAAHLLQREVIGRRLAGGASVARRLLRDAQELAEAARQDAAGRWGVILRPGSLKDILELARNGELLPAESTFFWPKFPAGLVMMPLEVPR